jgi:hypothetical protein
MSLNGSKHHKSSSGATADRRDSLIACNGFIFRLNDAQMLLRNKLIVFIGDSGLD